MTKRHLYILFVLCLAAMFLNLANGSCDKTGDVNVQVEATEAPAVEPEPEKDLVSDMLALNGQVTAMACYNNLAGETDGSPVTAKCEAYRAMWEEANVIQKGLLMTTGNY